MKRLFMFVFLGVALFGLTGCSDSSELEISTIPTSLQGDYSYNSSTGYSIVKNVLTLNSTTAEISKWTTGSVDGPRLKNSTTYTIKIVSSNIDKDYVEFDLYADGVRTYNCNTGFGKVFCDHKNGYSYQFNAD